MVSDILPPPMLTLRGGGFSVKNTSVFRSPELIGSPVPQGTIVCFLMYYRSAILSASVFRFSAALWSLS